ncbi:MAG: chorismate synthase [Spirochaetaceae bacterium]|jgi:chorismate synthase|nr:chorismate synthase [Spirochaetaceae bacterium]
MAGNCFGQIFKAITFGESHGAAVGCVVDGCPAGLALDADTVRRELARRRPGGSAASTSRSEADEPEILSGIFEGRTLGTPIAIVIRNTGQLSRDYDKLKDVYRPGHADMVWEIKYGLRDHRGGGRSSARETAARVAAGAVAKAFLAENGVTVNAWTRSIAGISAPDPGCGDFDITEKNGFCVPSRDTAAKIAAKIDELKAAGESAGGVVECRANGLPVGFGEPVFDKLDALLAQAVMSIGAVKGIEFGAGFGSAAMSGSESNDRPLAGYAVPARGGSDNGGRISYSGNNSGGVLGGISNGNCLAFRAAFKPVPSIAKKQLTVDRTGREAEIEIEGRHDICVCPRAVPVVEAMTALVLADLMLRGRAARL